MTTLCTLPSQNQSWCLSRLVWHRSRLYRRRLGGGGTGLAACVTVRRGGPSPTYTLRILPCTTLANNQTLLLQLAAALVRLGMVRHTQGARDVSIISAAEISP